MPRGVDVRAYRSSSYDTDGLSSVLVEVTEGRSCTDPRARGPGERLVSP